MLAKLVLWSIRNARFSAEDRALFTATLLHRFGAIDLHGIIRVEAGQIFVRDRPIPQEQVLQLRARQMLNSRARHLVREQVLSEAVNIGFTVAQQFEQVEFARAAVWFGTKEEELYEKLASQ